MSQLHRNHWKAQPSPWYQGINPLGSNQFEFILEKPEDISPLVFNQLIRKLNGIEENSEGIIPLVKDVRLFGKVSAILSHVVEMVVEYDDTSFDVRSMASSTTPSKQHCLPTHVVIKFLKPSIGMTHDMFRVEGNFYQHMTRSCHGNPFWIPHALYCSPTCIILEKVVHVINYNLLESCPTDRLAQVIHHLAEFHAFHWNDSSSSSSSTVQPLYSWPFPNLSPTAGMGANMSGPDKARLLVENYAEFCQHLLEQTNLDVAISASLETLGQELCDESSVILSIHESVYSFTPTLIHGDFHVGNMLFANTSRPVDNDDDEKYEESEHAPVWLLDWATCGKGNPLCDFVFFWVVSTRDADAATMWQHYLPLYYETLMKCRRQRRRAVETQDDDVPDFHDDDFSYTDCLQMARTCLIHQFILLVCYDTWTRNFLLEICEQQQDHATQSFYGHHFDNVNRRCTLAVLSDDVGISQHLSGLKQSE